MKITSTLHCIPSGKRGVKQTLEIMRELVHQAKKRHAIRILALRITKNINQKDYTKEIKKIFHFVQRKIRYVKDIRGHETLQIPEVTVKMRQGDCDDKSILIASLLESIGFKTRFVAVGFVPKKFSHVYTEVFLKNKWIALETTEPWEIGRKPKKVLNALILNN